MIYDEFGADLAKRKIPIVSLGRKEALKVFEENNLGANIEKGILAAEKRARELSK